MFEVISGKIHKAKKVVLYGPEGIGKSSLASQFPKPIFIDTEGSTTELVVDRLPKPTSWEMLKQQVNWVKQQVGRFETLVIDTIDWAEMQCNEFICAQHNKKGIEDFGYGKGYIYASEEFGRFLNLLSDVIEVGINVVLTAHSHVVKFEQPDEMGAYDRYQLKLGQKTGSRTAALVKEWADMVLFINYKTFSVATDDKGKKFKGQGGARMVYSTHHPAWDAKNRHGLPDEFPLDYAYIAHIFEGQDQQTQPQFQQQSQPMVQESMQHPAEVKTTQSALPLEQTILQGQAVQPQQQEPIQQEDPVQEQMATPITELNPNIPQSLRDLMIQNDVSEVEIQAVVSQRGYYPIDTPIENYDPNFIEGVLVGAWDQVFQMIKEFRDKLPF